MVEATLRLVASRPGTAVREAAAGRMRDDEIAEIFERYSRVVLRRARAILGDEDEAKDVAQDVFVRAFLESSTFQARSQITTWLYRITTNLCLNRIRDTKRRTALAAELYSDRPRPESDVDRVILVRKILAQAAEQESLAAIYVYIDGMSHREAAELLGVSRRTVGNLLERFERAAASVEGGPEAASGGRR